ncbi:hypothetical protein TcasGA2_TC003636 [Tribolium castaneum]|uniref:Uncharacterized protein n=1 Tax=Tribolium castaneum TaxID=7070 RepID=D6WIM6_TRICA|nr:hypothetical protein TcasGA2_TC003636 [Tribolium castaneum]
MQHVTVMNIAEGDGWRRLRIIKALTVINSAYKLIDDREFPRKKRQFASLTRVEGNLAIRISASFQCINGGVNGKSLDRGIATGKFLWEEFYGKRSSKD